MSYLLVGFQYINILTVLWVFCGRAFLIQNLDFFVRIIKGKLSPHPLQDILILILLVIFILLIFLGLIDIGVFFFEILE